MLYSITRRFLLLHAMPHYGKYEDVQLFMSLIDLYRFDGAKRQPAVDVSDVMRRILKEKLLSGSTPPFSERRAYTVNCGLSPLEAKLYNEARNMCRKSSITPTERKNTADFALTILHRILASSPEAFNHSNDAVNIWRDALTRRMRRRMFHDDGYMQPAELEDTEEKS
ncbi:MAG: hypothetical protein LBU32_27635 [Clostridiales bacterium]|jgi:hypothetical protein|nr:hypothetical protein [Clostridiales bacterium]